MQENQSPKPTEEALPPEAKAPLAPAQESAPPEDKAPLTPAQESAPSKKEEDSSYDTILPVHRDRPPVRRSAKRTATAFVSAGEATRISDPVSPPPAKTEKPPKPEEKKEAKPAPRRKKKAKAPEEADPKRPVKDRGGITLSLIKALLYITFVLAVAGYLGFTGIRWGNDIFAFVKEEQSGTVTIDEFVTVEDLAYLLHEQGLIAEPDAFKLYVGYKYRDKTLEFVPGTYELKSTMNYDQMIRSLIKRAPDRQIIKVTIPEGYTVDQIIDLLVNEYKIGGTREDYVKAINEYEYNYRFMEELGKIELSSDRKYRLEGYLYPATYDVYTDLSAVGVVDKFLSAFEERFEDSYYDRLTELNMNLDEAVTLASIVQAEGKFDSEYYLISSVFHNRLNSNTMKKLESDATLQYFLPERKEDLSQSDLDTDHPYNSYLYEGLTPSAICNPGLEAIHAALYPEETDYYYFVADVDGYSLFAQTNAQHEANKATVKKHKEELKSPQA